MDVDLQKSICNNAGEKLIKKKSIIPISYIAISEETCDLIGAEEQLVLNYVRSWLINIEMLTTNGLLLFNKISFF